MACHPTPMWFIPPTRPPALQDGSPAYHIGLALFSVAWGTHIIYNGIEIEGYFKTSGRAAMKYVFMDNFRGFTQTLLSIHDVNFLVGENSTGKTSVLALITLLSSPRLWFGAPRAFAEGEIDLGMFKDIVSVNSQNKGYFSVGFAEVSPKEKAGDAGQSYAFLCTFTDEEGMPRLTHYTTVMGEQLHLHLSPKAVKYKLEGSCELVDDPEALKGMFLRWADSHQEVSRGYNPVKMPQGLSSALISALSFLDYTLSRKHGAKRSNRFRFGVPRPFGDVVSLAPIRTRPQRTYDTYRLDFSPEGEHTPYLIKKLLSRRTNKERKQAERFLSFIEEFGKDSGLFKSIDIKPYDRKASTSPFELDIVIGRELVANESLSVDNVGYGVSQALPIIVELFARPPDTSFIIQQPEIHLHPRAQAALGKIIFELAILENKKFVIETHSDYTIDGFRLLYKEKATERKPDAQVVFFERKEGSNNLHEIPILQDGEISNSQPRAYREFFVKEQMRLLGLQIVHTD